MSNMSHHYPFQPPQHGDGMWPPLAYVLDALGVVFVGTLMMALLAVAFFYMPLIVH